MSHAAFSTEWLNRFSDPYALMGVSLAADERRILKRYRVIAKQLHPDALIDTPPELRQFAAQVLPKLVNPAYQRLKQDKGRNEVLATLRFKVRRLSRDQSASPVGEQSKKLLEVPEPEVEVFYEQAVERLCNRQYESVAEFEVRTQNLSELNLIYLRRKMGTPIIREKRAGLISTTSVPKSPASLSDLPADINSTGGGMYAERHYSRAQEYLKGKNVQAAIQELKDAIRIDPRNSSYHCLIGQAYLISKLTGMAKVHFKQALRLNPKNAVATKYAQQLNITVETQRRRAETVAVAASDRRSLFGSLFSKGTR
ncbi:MAG: DnaJ domain-containing protein [Nodosilinea sp.]